MKAIERQVYRAAYQDGLLETFLGGYLFIFGSLMVAKPGMASFSALTIFVIRPLFTKVKNRYTYPRVGYVKLPQENESAGKEIGLTAILFIVILVASLIVLSALMGNESGKEFWFRWFLPVLASILFSFGPLWMGRTYGLKRAYFIAVLIPLLGISMAITGIFTGYAAVGVICLTGGFLSLVSGVIMFSRFLRKYPVEEEVLNVSGQ